jgi:hypothetical protein
MTQRKLYCEDAGDPNAVIGSGNFFHVTHYKRKNRTLAGPVA